MRYILAALLAVFLSAEANAQTAQVDLTWQDNATNETGFEIERAPAVAGTFAKIGTTGANVVKFADTAVLAGACYRVRAVNAVGASGYSNVACISSVPNTPGGLTVTVTITVTPTP